MLVSIQFQFSFQISELNLYSVRNSNKMWIFTPSAARTETLLGPNCKSKFIDQLLLLEDRSKSVVQLLGWT